MPSKSQHGRRKRSPQSKKRKGGLSRPTMPAQQPAVAQIREPVSRPIVPVPSARVPTSVAKPAIAQYSNVATELRTIGILAGIMLIILIVLALVLH